MLTSQEAFDAYTSTWNTTDPGARHRLMEQSMVENAVMTYPPLDARGWEGISAAIGAFQQRLPGAYFVQTSEIEEHHGWFRVAWRMLAADGSAVRDGVDIAEVAGDGRLNRVIGFFDPLAPLPPFRPLSQSR